MSLLYLKKSTLTTLVYTACSTIARAINFILLPYFLSKILLSDFGLWDWYQSWINVGVLIGTSVATLSMARFALLYTNDSIKKKSSHK